MNDELQKALAAILNKTLNAAEAGVNFLQGQLPDVIHQLLVWKAVQSLLTFLILLAAVIVAWCVARGLEKKWSTDKWATHGMAYFFAGVCTIFISIPFFETGFDWLQIWLAPKLYLIEYAASLAKK